MDIENLIQKAREARTALLIAGEGAELEAKRLVALQEFLDVVSVYRELVIQGQTAAPTGVAEHLKSKDFKEFRTAVESYRGDNANSDLIVPIEHAELVIFREKIISYLEDLILSRAEK